MKKLNHGREFWVRRRHRERGQTAIILVLALSLFLLAFTGLAVDYSNLWFHRQAAQGAADAACQAGAMDLYNLTEGAVPGTPANFQPGFTPSATATYDCATTPGAIPCKYAALNGYSGTGLTASTESNDVAFSFPATITGVTAPPNTLAPVPFMRVDLTDRVPVYLSALISGNKTQDVLATAKCGLVLEKAPVPLVVLNPTIPNALYFNGSKATIAIYGGPNQSIEVNSSDSGAIGKGGTIDLSQGGENLTGSELGVAGGPASWTNGTFKPGTTGSWKINPLIPDPLALTDAPGSGLAPAIPGPPPGPSTVSSKCTSAIGTNGAPAGACNVAYLSDSCPDVSGCLEYFPGHYTSLLDIKDSKAHGTAIFADGLYYLDAGMQLDSNSVVRPSSYDGNSPAWGGTTFYFSGSISLKVDSNSGASPPGGFEPALDFDTSLAPCTAPGSTALPANVPANLSGNVLLAPCDSYYGDPGGKAQNRGILFFQDRSQAATSPPPNWGGGGAFLLSGTMYFHQCHTDGTDTSGTNCDTTPGNAYNTQLTLQGVSGSGTFLLGEVITDELKLGGNPTLNMDLNPAAVYDVLKVALLQ